MDTKRIISLLGGRKVARKRKMITLPTESKILHTLVIASLIKDDAGITKYKLNKELLDIFPEITASLAGNTHKISTYLYLRGKDAKKLNNLLSSNNLQVLIHDDR